MFANQRQLDAASLKGYAVELELDAEAFDACLDSNRFAADVRRDMAEGQQVGVTGTPAFLINGRFLSGAQPFEVFQQIIDEELAE